jgi:two-component system response regulator WspF
MRIAIANDMLLAVEAMRRIIVAQGRDQVAWIARDGVEAVRRCELDRPDLLLMDLLMPQMDGVEATRRIMAKSPCAIVIVTASVQHHAAKVFEAMGAGALDAVNTPVVVGPPGAAAPEPLRAKIETIRRLLGPAPRPRGTSGVEEAAPLLLPAPVPRVCLGASAGGPAALARVLSELPADFPAAIVIVQHVDAQFAPGLADWLRGQAKLPVRVGADGEVLQAGTVLLAGREDHLVLRSAQRVGYSGVEPESPFRPSVDVFFKSVARHRGPAGGPRGSEAAGPGAAALIQPVSTVGILLTGMGRDGAAGLLAMRERGLLTLAQDESSSAVFGMPKAAADLGAAREVLRLDQIAARLAREFATRRPNPGRP